MFLFYFSLFLGPKGFKRRNRQSSPEKPLCQRQPCDEPAKAAGQAKLSVRPDVRRKGPGRVPQFPPGTDT